MESLRFIDERLGVILCSSESTITTETIQGEIEKNRFAMISSKTFRVDGIASDHWNIHFENTCDSSKSNVTLAIVIEGGKTFFQVGEGNKYSSLKDAIKEIVSRH